MRKLKVMTIVGTRPEIIRLSRIMCRLDEECDHVIVHTGQNYDYELNEVFFNDLGLRKPDVFLEAASSTPIETIAKIMVGADKVFKNHNPDALLILGDTNSCLSVIAAKRRKIPIFHMEAGNRCFDLRVPEEINRRIVDHTADINLPYSSIARENLLHEGLPSDQIIKTGSPIYEVLEYYKNEITNSNVLNRLGLIASNYFLLSVHREENIEPDYNFRKVVEILNYLAETYNMPVVVSTHPRTMNRIATTNVVFHPNVRLLKPLGYHDYVNLQINSDVVISDSGTITEEASILNFPALNLRESHERQEGMEEAVVIMVGLDINRVEQGIQIARKQKAISNRTPLQKVDDYCSPNVSEKILRLIISYTNYINQKIWKKGSL